MKTQPRAKRSDPSVLLAGLRVRLRTAGSSRRAVQMQAYMKSAMPFHGVQTSRRRRIVRQLWDSHRPSTAAVWRQQVAGLWDGATHREERYAAIDWCRLAAAPLRGTQGRRDPDHFFLDLDALPLFEHMILTGAWWDLVDEVAAHQVGMLLERFPSALDPLLRQWAMGPELWKRRTAIIAQLCRKQETDTRLLAACILPSLHPSPFAGEFFIAKAIGWALRQHARVDPAWVRAFLRQHQDRLPSLSRREAAKHLGKRTAD